MAFDDQGAVERIVLFDELIDIGNGRCGMLGHEI
jgi:hypothetical protein